MSDNDLNEQLAQSLIQRNRDLIETHKQLLAVITTMDHTAKQVNEHVNQLRIGAAERERYVQYLESLVERNGWNPNEETKTYSQGFIDGMKHAADIANGSWNSADTLINQKQHASMIAQAIKHDITL